MTGAGQQASALGLTLWGFDNPLEGDLCILHHTLKG